MAMRTEMMHVKRVVWRISGLMLLITVVLTSLFYLSILRSTMFVKWKDLYQSTVHLTETATGDLIENNYIAKIKTNDFDEAHRDLCEGALHLDLARLYILDPYDMSYYDIYTSEQKDGHTYGRFYQKLSGCLDENSLSDAERKKDTTKPVYSSDISGTTIKAWTRVISSTGHSYFLCSAIPAEEVIYSCNALSVVLFALSFTICNVGFVLVYVLILRKLLGSIVSLSDDLDGYHTTGKMANCEYSDRMINKLGQDFRLLTENNSAYTLSACEKAKLAGIEEQKSLYEKQCGEFFRTDTVIRLPGEKGPEVCALLKEKTAEKGDHCDYVRISEGIFGFVIFALPRDNQSVTLPIFLRSAFRSEFSVGRSPEKIAERLSAEIRKNFGEDVCVRALFGTVNQEGQIRFVNAGYNIPFVCEAGQKACFLEGDCGPALGTEDAVYLAETVKLPEDSLLVCFSGNDGEETGQKGREKMKLLLDRFTEERQDRGVSGGSSAMDLREYLETSGETVLIIRA